MGARSSFLATVLLLLLLVECQAWTHRSYARSVLVVRGGSYSSTDDEEFVERPQKKRKKQAPREEIVDEDEYEEEWIEDSQEFTEEEDAFIVENEEEDNETLYDAVVSDADEEDSRPQVEEQVQERSSPPKMDTGVPAAVPAAIPVEPAAAMVAPDDADTSSSSADNVDRLELADAYDDDMAATLDPPTFIDAQTERILKRDLKYSGREVSQMKPAVAAVVVAKRLHRPLEGMPRNWFKSPPSTAKPKQKIQWKRVLPKLIIPVAVGALVIAQGENIMEAAMEMLSGEDLSETLQQQPPSSPAEEQDPYASMFADETAVHEPPPPSDHKPHSIKPGTMPDDELDVTWLDKFLTAVERKVKAFFRWKI